jgi:hypothetical protein
MGFIDTVARAAGSLFGKEETPGTGAAPAPVPAQQPAPVPAAASAMQPPGSTGRGLGGAMEALADPKGALDRMAASKELLANKSFSLLPPGATGPHAANALSQEEFDKVVRTYSDIRLGRGDLTIDTAEMGKAEGAAYQKQIMGDVTKIMQTESGRRQIMGMSNNVLKDDQGRALDEKGNVAQPGQEVHRHTTIGANYQMDVDPATGKPSVTPDNANAFAAPAVRQNETRGYRDPKTGAQGLGLDAQVRINPAVESVTGTRSDLLLAHELEHARHTTQGIMEPGVIQYGQGPKDIPSEMPVITPGGANVVYAREHQAMGVGNYPMYPQRGGKVEGMTEAAYVAERNAMGDNLPARQGHRDLGPTAPGAPPPPALDANVPLNKMYDPLLPTGVNRQ